MDNIIFYILSFVAVLVILSIHEFSHGYVAYKLGDNTAKNMGRLTLNPLSHLDPLGAVCMMLFHFGWAKPVPIDPRNFKNPKKGFALVALAGPLSNLIMAFLSAFFYLLLNAALTNVAFSSNFLLNVVTNTVIFIYIFHAINIGLAIFNLLPIPPLDGSRLLNVILPPRLYFKVMRHERNIYWILVGWLILGTYVSRFLLRIPIIQNTPGLEFIARFLSLSDILATIFGWASEMMMRFWQLIPFLRA